MVTSKLHFAKPRFAGMVMAITILVTACSGSGERATEITQPSETSMLGTSAPQAPSSQTTIVDPGEASTEESTTSIEALRPYGDNPPPETDEVDDSVYITRKAMSATSIEVAWSTHEGAVEYHLHRISGTVDRPQNAAMNDDNRLAIVDDRGGYVDNTVDEGERYWYGLRAFDVDGSSVAHGWHSTAAVTDVEPPSTVETVAVVSDNGEVLITWSQPNENYELHAYSVLRGVNGEELEVVTTTWDLDRISFIDDNPPASGTVTYAVQASDFHWNKSTLAPIDVDLG